MVNPKCTDEHSGYSGYTQGNGNEYNFPVGKGKKRTVTCKDKAGNTTTKTFGPYNVCKYSQSSVCGYGTRQESYSCTKYKWVKDSKTIAAYAGENDKAYAECQAICKASDKRGCYYQYAGGQAGDVEGGTINHWLCHYEVKTAYSATCYKDVTYTKSCYHY